MNNACRVGLNQAVLAAAAALYGGGVPTSSVANLPLGFPGGFGPEQSALVAGQLEAQQLSRVGAMAGAPGVPALLAPSLLQQQSPQVPASPFALPIPGSPTTPVWPVPGAGPFSAPSQNQSQSVGPVASAPSQELLLGAVASLLCRRWNSTPDGSAGQCNGPDGPQDLTLPQPPPCQPPTPVAALPLPPAPLRSFSLDPNAAFSASPSVFALRPLASHDVLPTRSLPTPHETLPLPLPVSLSSLRALLPFQQSLLPDLPACGARPETAANSPLASPGPSSVALPPLAHVHVHPAAPPPPPADTCVSLSSSSLSSAADLCAGRQQQQQSPNEAMPMPVPLQNWQRHLLALLTGGSLAGQNQQLRTN